MLVIRKHEPNVLRIFYPQGNSFLLGTQEVPSPNCAKEVWEKTLRRVGVLAGTGHSKPGSAAGCFAFFTPSLRPIWFPWQVLGRGRARR